MPYATQNSVVDICKLLWWRLALGLLLASRPCGLLEKQMVSDVFTINLHASNAFLDDHGRCERDDLGSRCFDFTTGFPCILDVILKRHHLSIIHMTYTSSLIDTRVTTSCVLCWLWQERNGRKTRTQGKKRWGPRSLASYQKHWLQSVAQWWLSFCYSLRPESLQAWVSSS